MSFYGYEYFCGANVIVEINNVSVLECAGFSMNIQESKIPIYGYSSRMFDAVARGRVLVQGTMLVNYVDHDYMYHAINVGNRREQEFADIIRGGIETDDDGLSDMLANPETAQGEYRNMVENYPNEFLRAEAFKRELWPKPDLGNGEIQQNFTWNPHDLASGVDIKVTFGDRAEQSNMYGSTGFLIRSAYFMGRGVGVQISEDVIVEEISFIARNIESLASQPRTNSVAEFNSQASDRPPVVAGDNQTLVERILQDDTASPAFDDSNITLGLK